MEFVCLNIVFVSEICVSLFFVGGILTIGMRCTLVLGFLAMHTHPTDH